MTDFPLIKSNVLVGRYIFFIKIFEKYLVRVRRNVLKFNYKNKKVSVRGHLFITPLHLYIAHSIIIIYPIVQIPESIRYGASSRHIFSFVAASFHRSY